MASLVVLIPPGPGIAEPERREHMQRRCFWTAICGSNTDEYILWIDFGILDGDIEVAILRKNACVDQFIFRFASPATAILRRQFNVREGALRILVQGLHIRMGGGTVKKVVVLLHILPVIAFWTGQAEEPLLENRVGLIPQAEREAQQTLFVTDTQQTIFAPAIGAGTSVVMGKKVPGVPRGGVVLTDGPPLALAQIGSPAIPGFCMLVRLGKSQALCVMFQGRSLSESFFAAHHLCHHPFSQGRPCRLCKEHPYSACATST